MTISIGILREEISLDFDPEGAVYLNDDGYFWFLQPTFRELHAKTGQNIDLYETAIFRGEKLLLLRVALQEGLELVKNQPPEWQVHVGLQIYPATEELLSTVSREEFMELLHDFDKLVSRAIEQGEAVLCLGD